MKIDFAQVFHQLVPGIISLMSGGPSSLTALCKNHSRTIFRNAVHVARLYLFTLGFGAFGFGVVAISHADDMDDQQKG
jgi:hypothetical protein